MAVYMNAKGTTNTSFQYGRRGAKIFGGVATPTDSEVSTGDIWLDKTNNQTKICLLYTSPSPRDQRGSRMPSSA